MSLLFTLVYAGHARGSHHKLALDAVKRLRGPGAEDWQRLFLKHATTFVPASKVPDDEFKDFKNHVLHPRDNYWGGAPLACRKWYDTMVTELRAGEWQKAIYAAGVLSHYVSDPHHPFHTGQSEAETAIHRAGEWSISRAYDSLRAEGDAKWASLSLGAPADPNWLTLLVGQGADKANGYYEKLIAHYDINRGVVDPPSGLDPVARRIMSEMIHYTAEAISVVFTMAFAEADVTPPKVSVTAQAILAAITIPKNRLLKNLENAAEKKVVAAMYDELKATGTVDKTLPEDDRAVRDAYAVEVIAKRTKVDVAKVFPLSALPPVDSDSAAPTTVSAKRAAVIPDAPLPATPAPATPAPGAVPIDQVQSSEHERVTAAAAAVTEAPVESVRAGNISPARAADAGAAATAAGLMGISASAGSWRTERSPIARRETSNEQRDTIDRTRPALLHDADVVDAPSIGPKTADRLYAVGIKTVADLLAGDPADISARLATRWIGTTTVADWQAQTKLAIEVPGLRDTHTQLLVGAGYRDAATLADADADTLAADVLTFATSTEGRRVLRDGDPPDLEKIKGWLAAARSTRAA